MDGAHQVERHHPLEQGRLRLHEGGTFRRPGIVDQDVDLAPGGDGLGDRGTEAFRIGHVRLNPAGGGSGGDRGLQ